METTQTTIEGLEQRLEDVIAVLEALNKTYDALKALVLVQKEMIDHNSQTIRKILSARVLVKDSERN